MRDESLSYESELLCLLIDGNATNFKDLLVGDPLRPSYDQYFGMIKHFMRYYALCYPENVIVILGFNNQDVVTLYKGFARGICFGTLLDAIYREIIGKIVVTGPSIGSYALLKALGIVMAYNGARARVLYIMPTDDFEQNVQIDEILNVGLCAQKNSVVVDTFSMTSDVPSAWQKCSVVTGGLTLGYKSHVNPENWELSEGRLALMKSLSVEVLGNFLVFMFLTPVRMRSDVLAVPSFNVKNSAVCDCHRRAVHIGYVCSVCYNGKFPCC